MLVVSALAEQCKTPGGYSYILVYTCVNKTNVKRGPFFAVECVKLGMHVESKMSFFRKKGMVLSKFYSDCSDTNIIRG